MSPLRSSSVISSSFALLPFLLQNVLAQAATTPSCTSYLYTVPSLGTFTNFANYTFTNLDGSLPAGLTATDGRTIGNAPYSQIYQASNVVVRDGFMQLMVPGGQMEAPYSSAQVVTQESEILYASVRTTAILSTPAGTVNGMFFYQSDSQESDIEYVTNSSARINTALAKESRGTIPVMYTNQPTSTGAGETHTGVPSPGNATLLAHEYRWDWMPGSTAFYIDGVLSQNLTTNVPDVPGKYMFNNWCNGSPGFSTGPPVENSVFYISNVVMYYNTTASAGYNGTCDASCSQQCSAPGEQKPAEEVFRRQASYNMKRIELLTL